MQDRLRARRELRRRGVCISVPREQHTLEEQHAGRPHRRCAAEPGQYQARNERLDQKQQKRRQKDRDGVKHEAGRAQRASE